MPKATENKAKPKRARIVRQDAPTFTSYYANNSEVGMTLYDVSIRFGRILSLDSAGLHVEDQAVVTMAVPHAKALMMILTSYVNQYEEEHGILPTPFSSVPKAESVEQSIPSGLYNPDEKE